MRLPLVDIDFQEETMRIGKTVALIGALGVSGGLLVAPAHDAAAAQPRALPSVVATRTVHVAQSQAKRYRGISGVTIIARP